MIAQGSQADVEFVRHHAVATTFGNEPQSSNFPRGEREDGGQRSLDALCGGELLRGLDKLCGKRLPLLPRGDILQDVGDEHTPPPRALAKSENRSPHRDSFPGPGPGFHLEATDFLPPEGALYHSAWRAADASAQLVPGLHEGGTAAAHGLGPGVAEPVAQFSFLRGS